MIQADLGSPRRKRRWVSFSLRSFIVGVGIFAIWLGWLVSSANRQQKAVRAIRARNGSIEYDYQYDADRNIRLSKNKSSHPVWLQRLVGDDYFYDVTMVGLDVDESYRSVDVTDADLVYLEELRHLKFLYLGGGRITDDGLKNLENLTELRFLVLGMNPIRGDGLKHLSRLQDLRKLDLSQTQVTDERLSYLKNLKGLEEITLAGNPQLTGEFLEYVAELPNLRHLVLRRSGITDSGLAHLKRSKSLQSLWLDRTQVTDAGMVHLQDLRSLGTLDVSATAVSPATIVQIQQWLPGVVVTPTIAKQGQ